MKIVSQEGERKIKSELRKNFSHSTIPCSSERERNKKAFYVSSNKQEADEEGGKAFALCCVKKSSNNERARNFKRETAKSVNEERFYRSTRILTLEPSTWLSLDELEGFAHHFYRTFHTSPHSIKVESSSPIYVRAIQPVVIACLFVVCNSSSSSICKL